jgi:hypothetical protein
MIESRDAHLGALSGVAFAEGLLVKEPVLRPTIFRSWSLEPGGRS